MTITAETIIIYLVRQVPESLPKLPAMALLRQVIYSEVHDEEASPFSYIVGGGPVRFHRLCAPAVLAPEGQPLEQTVPDKEAKIDNQTPAQTESGIAARFTLTKITVQHEELSLSDNDLAALAQPYTGRDISGKNF